MKELLILMMVVGVLLTVWWFTTQRGNKSPDYGSGYTPDDLRTRGEVAIGDIYVSPSQVTTPTGTYPIRNTKWAVTDMSHSESYVSPAGIVLAILFIWFCFLGLLFLAMREHRMVGYVQVTVQGNGFAHSTLIPSNSYALTWVTQHVNYARALAAAA